MGRSGLINDARREDNTLADDLKSPRSVYHSVSSVVYLVGGVRERKLVQPCSPPLARHPLFLSLVGDDSFRETAVKGTPVGAGTW